MKGKERKEKRKTKEGKKMNERLFRECKLIYIK